MKNNKNIICFTLCSLLTDRTLASLPSPENNENNPQQTQLLHPKQRKQRNFWTEKEDILLMKFFLEYGPNWPKVAEGIPNRNANQCREHFKTLQKKISPKKTRNPWTQEEDALLVNAVRRYGLNWPKVAKNIPNRNGRKCKQRWEGLEQKKAKRKTGPWTQEEEKLLIESVKTYGPAQGRRGYWKEIATLVPGRSHRQCRNHWVECCNPHRKHEPWSEEEDKILIENYFKFGPQWKEIAPFLPGRTLQDLQNHSRYIPIDDNSQPWSEEENKNFIAYHSKFGPQWKEIAPFFQGRSPLDLKRLWKRIAPDSKQTTPSIKENQSSLPGKTVPDVGKNWKRIVLSGKQTTTNGGKNQSSLPGEMDERKVKLSSLLRPSNEIITPPPPLIIPGGS
ncbi:MAG: hypothetical protein LBI77_00270 [Puniceicoccales bacterium]|nr:hypothetical protein [Puniceicoccales bacterium]